MYLNISKKSYSFSLYFRNPHQFVTAKYRYIPSSAATDSAPSQMPAMYPIAQTASIGLDHAQIRIART